MIEFSVDLKTRHFFDIIFGNQNLRKRKIYIIIWKSVNHRGTMIYCPVEGLKWYSNAISNNSNKGTLCLLRQFYSCSWFYSRNSDLPVFSCLFTKITVSIIDLYTRFYLIFGQTCVSLFLTYVNWSVYHTMLNISNSKHLNGQNHVLWLTFAFLFLLIFNVLYMCMYF